MFGPFLNGLFSLTSSILHCFAMILHSSFLITLPSEMGAEYETNSKDYFTSERHFDAIQLSFPLQSI